jgi:hypothetical protein
VGTVVKKAEVIETESVKVEDMAGWEKLSPSEKKVVRAETEAADQAFLAHNQTRIATGQHLARIQSVLEPKRLFLAFLEGFCRKHDISQRTGYRYIDDFKAVAERVPEQVLNDAVKNGVELAGRAAKKALSTAPPVSASATRKESEEWLETVAQKRKEARVDAANQTMTPKESILAIVKVYNSQFKQLGTDRTKRRFLEETVGALMTITGLGSATTFYPVAVPEGWNTEGTGKRRGRTPKSATTARAAVA